MTPLRQNLHHHPHVHAVVTGGGLSCNLDGSVDQEPVWRSCRKGFFLPVRVLSRVFRGKYLELLRAAFDRGQVNFPDHLAHLANAEDFTPLADTAVSQGLGGLRQAALRRTRSAPNQALRLRAALGNS